VGRFAGEIWGGAATHFAEVERVAGFSVPTKMKQELKMKKIVLAALAGSAFVAAPAAAQTSVSGQINLTGTVADKCIVTNAGSAPNGSAFGGSVDLGQLDATDGRLEASGTLATRFAGAGAANLSYRIVCTTAKTQVTVNANELTTGAAVSSGYANTIHYDAHIALSLVGGAQTLSNDTLNAPAGSTTTYNDRLATGATNVNVTASNFRTVDGNAVLLAGTYAGNIQITVAPAT
jgi:hypothetical protein